MEMDGDRVVRIVEKPSLDDAPSNTLSLPHYVFSARLLDLLPRVKASPRGEYEIQDAIQQLIDDGGTVIGVHAHERSQVSTMEDLLTLTRKLLSDQPELGRVDPSVARRASATIEPTRIDAGVELGEGCEIGPETYLESGCSIGDDAIIRRSVVLRDGRVGDGDVVEDSVVT